MNNIVIQAQGLGKKYVIGHHTSSERYISLRDKLTNNARRFLNKTTDLILGKPVVSGDSLEDVWVLQDLNFEIRQGDVVGIIGRNGAGKSTLLKILSRITEPSTGLVTVKGRVASLLEVGTGFHPELTGRENIFLNGSILGMSRTEIKNKFDAIVDFAGVEKFLDTPVKRYSSGMYVRLAFSVSAHLEPDILIVDEVLAVGDFDFQKKCLSKMDAVSQEGRTVLVVSHNLPLISSLCEKCMLLDRGNLVEFGSTSDVLSAYSTSSFSLSNNISNYGSNNSRYKIKLLFSKAVKEDCIASNEFTIFDNIYLQVAFEVLKNINDAIIPFFHIINERGDYVLLTFPTNWPENAACQSGKYIATCHIPKHFLNTGSYSVHIQMNSITSGHNLEFFEHHALRFVVREDLLGNPYRSHTKYSYEWPGAVRPLLDWNLVSITD